MSTANPEWVNAAARAIHTQDPDAVQFACAAAAVSAVEPLIRADERERVIAEGMEILPVTIAAEMSIVLTDLRAKVEGLSLSGTSGERYGFDMALRAVLALIDKVGK
jgi:hypothetical protein